MYDDEDKMWDMSDEELEKAFREAQASQQSPDTDLENTSDESRSDVSEAETSEENTDLEEETEETGDDTSEEDLEDGPEQPDADSDRDSSDDSDKETEADENPSDEEKEASNEEPNSDEEENSEDDESEEEKKQTVQSHKFRANGKEYEFTSDEIVEQFPRIFGQAMDYTKKMQAIKPWRKTIDAIESAELNHDDVSLMIDVLKGDKDAITEVLKRTKVDTLDLNTEEDSKYVAKDYGRDESALAIKDIVEDIGRDAEYATTHNILSKEWDDRSWKAMTEDPEKIRLLHIDVKSGLYNTLQPQAEKLKVFDGNKKSDLEYYIEAAQQHFTRIAQENAASMKEAEKTAKADTKKAEKDRLEEVQAKSEQREATKKASEKRKAAAPTSGKRASTDVIDYLDDSDEAFEEWYKKLQQEM